MNEEFLSRIQSYIPEEYPAFLKSLQNNMYQGLRVNPLKADPAFMAGQLPFLQRPSVFAPDAWYITGSYGLHPYHIQGRYYLQEPSAGSAVSALELQDGETVLDLCAAPGGKSTQIAGFIPNGFLVSNEIEPKRAQVLLSNLERMGVENFCLTSMDAKTLCSQTPEAFDKILVDAPCSGEGMMKKHEEAADWSLENVLLCAARQKEILQEAWQALKPGGRLVYSTCTYAREENEDNIAWLLDTFADARQVPISGNWGRPGLETAGMDSSLVRRIFPMDQGEGHFVAALEKIPAKTEGPEKEVLSDEADPIKKSASLKETGNQIPDGLVLDFLTSQLPGKSLDLGNFPDQSKQKQDEKEASRQEKQRPQKKSGKGVKGKKQSGSNPKTQELAEQYYSNYQMIKNKEKTSVYAMNHPFIAWKKGKVLRQGVYLGDILKNRFEPAHAFFMSTDMLKGKTLTEVSLEEMDAFVHGQQILHQSDKGWRALSYQGVPFGFGKSDGTRITNKYPKGLRLNPGSHVMGLEDCL